MNQFKSIVILGCLVLGCADMSEAQSKQDFEVSSNEEIFFHLAKLELSLVHKTNNLSRYMRDGVHVQYLQTLHEVEWARADEFKRQALLKEYEAKINAGIAAADLSEPLIFSSERNNMQAYNFDRQGFPFFSHRLGASNFTLANGNGSARVMLPTCETFDQFLPMTEVDAQALKTENKYLMHDQYFHVVLKKGDDGKPCVDVQKIIFTDVGSQNVIGTIDLNQ